MDSEAVSSGEYGKFTPTADQSVLSATTSLGNSLFKRDCSDFDDTTDAPNKKLKLNTVRLTYLLNNSTLALENQPVTHAKEILPCGPAHVIDMPIIDAMHRIQHYDLQGVILLNDRFTVGDRTAVSCLSPGELLYLGAKQYLEMDAHEGVCRLALETNCSLEYEYFSMPPSVSYKAGSLKVPLIAHGGMGSISGSSQRIFKMNVLEELVPLTSETGKSFVDAWVDIVTCHAFLWKHSITHIDPSLWNVKYHPIRKCGVLTDFDLLAMSRRRRVPGTDRTGTIPFMALDLLLGEYGKDKVTRHYHHELEAFIWMLPFIFLAYSNGKLDPKNQFIEYWITSDYTTCGEKKNAFLYRNLANPVSLVGSAFESYKMLMFKACFVIWKQATERQDEANEIFPQRMFPERFKISGPVPQINHSARMWDEFIPILSRWGLDATRLQQHRPTFDRTQYQDLFDEITAIYDSLRLPV